MPRKATAAPVSPPPPVSPAAIDADGPTFEQALHELEQIVHDLEEGQLGLNAALQRYEEGIKLLRRCQGLLDGAQRKIEILSGVDSDGNPITSPFDHVASVVRDAQHYAETPAQSYRPGHDNPRPGGTPGMDEPGGRS